MSGILKGIFQFGMLVTMVFGFIAFVASFLFSLKTIHQARPGVGVWSKQTFWNPYNLLFMPSLLTDEGRVTRRLLLKAWAVFFVSVGLGLVFGFIADSL